MTTLSPKIGFPILDLTLGDSDTECGCDLGAWDSGLSINNQLSESEVMKWCHPLQSVHC